MAHGHVPRRKPTDGFEDVAAANASLGSRAIRKNGENDHIAEAFAERQAGFAGTGILQFLFVFVVFPRREVAGLGVKRFKQAVEGTRSHRMHVRVIHVVLLDLL